MKGPKLLSWQEALLNLERIPELIKYLVLKGQNTQQIMHNEELRFLFFSHRFQEDFLPDLVQYNYRNLYYMWSQQGPYSLPNIIKRLEAKSEWHGTQWRAFLSPVEVQIILAITEHTQTNLDYLYQGLIGDTAQSPQVRFINFFRHLQARIIQELQLLAPFEEEAPMLPSSMFDH